MPWPKSINIALHRCSHDQTSTSLALLVVGSLAGCPLSEACFGKSKVTPHARDILFAIRDVMDDLGDNILNSFSKYPCYNITRDISLSLFRAVKNGPKCYIG